MTFKLVGMIIMNLKLTSMIPRAVSVRRFFCFAVLFGVLFAVLNVYALNGIHECAYGTAAATMRDVIPRCLP